jgi:hypothetical protein
MRALAAIMAATCLLLPSAAAQPAPNRVFVDASSAAGRPVLDLRADEFEITENGDVTDHFAARGGTLHAIRLTVLASPSSIRSGNLTEMPVSLMIGRDTGGAYTIISPAGLLEVCSGWRPPSTTGTLRC